MKSSPHLSGVALYTGVPGAGKTTLALAHAAADIASTGRPLLVIDSEGTVKHDDLERAADVRQAIDLVWEHGRHVALVPEGEEDVDRLCAAARAGKDIVLIIDEIGHWGSAHATLPELERLIRAHRHCRVMLRATTQYPSDLAPVIHACCSELWAFRTHQARAAVKLQSDYSLDPEKLRALKRGETLQWARDFA